MRCITHGNTLFKCVKQQLHTLPMCCCTHPQILSKHAYFLRFPWNGFLFICFRFKLADLMKILERFTAMNTTKSGVVSEKEFLSHLQWPVVDHAKLLFKEYNTVSWYCSVLCLLIFKCTGWSWREANLWLFTFFTLTPAVGSWVFCTSELDRLVDKFLCEDDYCMLSMLLLQTHRCNAQDAWWCMQKVKSRDFQSKFATSEKF